MPTRSLKYKIINGQFPQGAKKANQYFLIFILKIMLIDIGFFIFILFLSYILYGVDYVIMEINYTIERLSTLL